MMCRKLGRWALLGYLWACLNSAVQGQGITSNPYTTYGLGEIVNPATSRNYGMAGIGQGTVDRFNLTRSNPAQLGDLLLTTVDISGVYRTGTIEGTDPQREATFRGGALQNLALAFPSNKGFRFAFGLLPYSAVGYGVNRDGFYLDDQLDTVQYVSRVSAEGGLNELFLTVAYKKGKKWGYGLRTSFLFGSIDEAWSTVIENSNGGGTNRRLNTLNALKLGAGVTYTDSLNEKRIIRVGASVDLPARMTLAQRRIINTNDDLGIFTDTIEINRDNRFTLPAFFSVGVGIESVKGLSVALEGRFQDWSTFDFRNVGPDSGQALQSSWHAILGLEYLPNYLSPKYFNRTAYRAGVRVGATSLKLDGQSLPELAVTFGMGLPLFRQNSQVQLGVELGSRGTTNSGLLQERYIQFMLGMSFNERWFIRRKYD